jgi:NADPH:quinone reductase-like Zn-dependent oxidoreductase
MKAIVYHNYGPPGVLRVEEVEKPTPGDNEVLIRIDAAAVTPPDVAARKGEPFIARYMTGFTKPKKPILGALLAGEVEAVGKDVGRFREGDQVVASTGLGFGAYAEYTCIPEEGVLASKPANTTYADAVAICEGALTALPFLRDRGMIRSGHKVLVNGASGSIGTSAVQLAKHFEAEVTGVCSTTNVELVKSLGADAVIDYKEEDFTKTGQTYDIVFDAVGKSSFSRCRGSLKQGGVYLTTVPSLVIPFQMLWTSRIGSRKAILFLAGKMPASEKTKDLVFLTGLIEAGEMEPVIDRCYPLEQTAEAHAYVEKGHKKGSVVITVERDSR